MTALIVIGIIIAVLLLISLIRVSVHIAYDEKLVVLVSVLGITVYSTDKQKKAAEKTDEAASQKKSPQKQDNVFKKIYKQKGLKYTVEVVGDAVKRVVNKLLWLIRRLKIRNFKFLLSVTGDDAADTAIKYGAVCAAVYPIFAFVDSNLDFKPKSIDVYADFEGKDIKFSVSTDIKAEIFVLVALAISCFKEYFKFKKSVEMDLISAQNINNNSHKEVL